MNVCDGTKTSSPDFMPRALREIVNASNPLPTPTENFALKKDEKFFSNSSSLGPKMKLPESTTSFIFFLKFL